MGFYKQQYRVDLCAHLTECDVNYLRLCKLLEDSATGEFKSRSLQLGTNRDSVIFSIIQHCRYTTIVGIECAMPHGIPDLSLRVRVYHDARAAEVINYQHQHRFAAHYDYPNSKMRLPDEKMQINQFLGEFLSVCLAKGRAVTETYSTPEGVPLAT